MSASQQQIFWQKDFLFNDEDCLKLSSLRFTINNTFKLAFINFSTCVASIYSLIIQL